MRERVAAFPVAVVVRVGQDIVPERNAVFEKFGVGAFGRLDGVEEIIVIIPVFAVRYAKGAGGGFIGGVLVEAG